MQDIFSGSGRSEEMESLLVNRGEAPDCTLRLCCLQRLQVQGLSVFEMKNSGLDPKFEHIED